MWAANSHWQAASWAPPCTTADQARGQHTPQHGVSVDRADIWNEIFLIWNFRRVLYVVCFPLGNSPASEFYMLTFRNTLFHLHRQVGVGLNVIWVRPQNVPTCFSETLLNTYLPMKMEQSVPKRRHIKFRRRGITQKKICNIWNEMFFNHFPCKA